VSKSGTLEKGGKKNIKIITLFESADVEIRNAFGKEVKKKTGLKMRETYFPRGPV